jgi:glucose uptake protein GlcU
MGAASLTNLMGVSSANGWSSKTQDIAATFAAVIAVCMGVMYAKSQDSDKFEFEAEIEEKTIIV